eukprot:COSAG05_NODE_868_length_6866_cov_131.011231_9_plen_93_part_00
MIVDVVTGKGNVRMDVVLYNTPFYLYLCMGGDRSLGKSSVLGGWCIVMDQQAILHGVIRVAHAGAISSKLNFCVFDEKPLSKSITYYSRMHM